MARQFIALIRHGDYHQLNNVPSAHQPFSLTEKGQQQAIKAAESVENFCHRFHCVVDPEILSSELLRAWQTASIMSEQLSTQTQLTSTMLLAERSVGIVANLSIAEIKRAIIDDPRYSLPPDDWKSDSYYQLPFAGAESLIQAGERVANYITTQIKTLTVKKHNSLKLFVGHGAAFRHAAYHLGLLHYEQIKQLSMFHAHPIFFELASNGIWQHCAGNWKQRQLTDKLD